MPSNSDEGFIVASLLFSDPDPNISRISLLIYNQLLEQNQKFGYLPVGVHRFNIHYLFESAIHEWLSRKEHTVLQSSHFPIGCAPISGTNWPIGDLSEHSNFVRGYIERVRSESVPDGYPFDVSYAARILDLVFSDTGDLRIPASSSLSNEVDYDEWLSGFNAPKE